MSPAADDSPPRTTADALPLFVVYYWKGRSKHGQLAKIEISGFRIVEKDDMETSKKRCGNVKNTDNWMYFETIEEARNYYERYDQENGFWIRTRASSKGRNWSNEVTKVLFVCVKEGKYLGKKQQESVVEKNDKTDEKEKVIPKKRFRRSTIK
ncbi:hypothetical protein RHSIM_Rhsim01G0147800 [Rhododendron simsii]|uniref:FAR1 domain-containing protein n=1 Tax=Rhododendron simsii TaxID=118357 RepID=A0A834HFR9_RHOSS|nr:hypothetical protein RHSIM_Rhsim01G0147800 [Rhododendron simsii]